MKVSKEQVYQGLINRGLSPNAAAGVVGNLAAESSLNSEAVNPSSKAFGLAQWLGSRKTQLSNFASSSGRDISDPELQMDFLIQELGSTEKRAGKALNNAKSPAEAADVFVRKFERPSEKEIADSIDKRVAVANSLAGSPSISSFAKMAGDAYREALKANPNLTKEEFKQSDTFKQLLGGQTKPPSISPLSRKLGDAYKAALNSNPNLTKEEFKNTELYNSIVGNKPKELTVTDNTKPDTVETTVEDKIFDTVGFGLNSINKGLASTADAIINTPENLMKMGVAGVSYGLNKAGLLSADELPSINTPTNLVTDTAVDTGVISSDTKYNPTSSIGRVADIALQSATGGLANKGNLVKNLVTGASVGAGIGTALEAGADPTTAIGLGVVTPILAKGAIKIPSKVISAVDRQLPFYTDKGANIEAARRIIKQADTKLTPQELAITIENKLATGDKQLHTTGELLGNNNLRAAQTSVRANPEEYANLNKAVNQDVIDKTNKVFNTKPGTGGFVSTKNKLFNNNTEQEFEFNNLNPNGKYEPHNVIKIFNASNTPEELVNNLLINSSVKEINLQGIKSLVKDGVITKQNLVKTIKEGLIDNNSTNPQVNTVRLNNILSDPSNTKTITYLLGGKNAKVQLKNKLQTDINERSSVISTERNSTSILDTKVDNLLNKNPTLANTVVAGTVGLVTGNPLYGVLSGVLGKSVTSSILNNLTQAQNAKLQAAITKGLLNPKELAETLKGMKPQQANTTLVQKLNSIKLEGNNLAYTLPSTNVLPLTNNLFQPKE